MPAAFPIWLTVVKTPHAAPASRPGTPAGMTLAATVLARPSSTARALSLTQASAAGSPSS